MADQHYPRPSSPGRVERGFSDASISLSPFGGSAPGSALGQNSDLLGLPGPTSMSFDYASVPRTFSSTSHHASRGSNNPYNTGLFLDSDSDQQQSASDSSATQWAPNYALQPGSTNITAASVIPINRFQSEQQPSWTPLRIGLPLRPSSGTTYPQQRLGQLPGPLNPFLPGPSSDRFSHTNETDEGYCTNSQPDAQSVHSMGPWKLNQDPQNMQHRHLAVPSAYAQPGPGNPGSEPLDSDVQHNQINANHAVQPQQGPDSLACRHEGCGYVSRTQSDFKKHAARHDKEHVCMEHGCPRTEGFATINDLERHQKSVHKIQPEHGQSKEFKCFGESCPKHEKEWPRFDNFKQHLKRMHPGEGLEMLINKSNEWYERHRMSRPTPAVTTAQRPSSSTSQQATPQTTIQMGRPFSTPGHQNQRINPSGSRVATTVSPGRNLSTSYPQSEAGKYSASFSGSSTSDGRSRPSSGRIQFPSNLALCPISGCSQALGTVDDFREHLRLTHGPHNVSTPCYPATQVQGSLWPRSQSNPGNQAPLSSRQYMSVEESADNAMRVQSQYRPQTRVVNGGYGPRTAPNPSIPKTQVRLGEDFDSSTMVQPQDALFATGSSDNILAQIGMMDEFQPEGSQTANLGLDSSQEQALNIQEDPQKKSTSPLIFDALKSFLREHFPDDKIDFATSMMQNTFQSLQSKSSSSDLDNTVATASALNNKDFESSIRDGKEVYRCPAESCEKIMARRCELRKHFQRHTLPWACTFDNCRSPYRHFGSKNDWKRHESKQHAQQERWRCEEHQSNTTGRSVPAVGDDACRRLFCTKDLYRKHLNDQHHISDSNLANELCGSQRIGARCQGQYWCGFCNKIIVLKWIGVDANSERYNHIDRHFTKDLYHIRDWKPLNGRPSPGDSALASALPSPVESTSARSDEAETNEDAAAEAEAIQNTHTPQGSKKRRASTMAGGDRGPAPKAARTVGPRAHKMTTCCHCLHGFPSWLPVCTNCSHQVCRICSTEVVKQREQD